MQSVNRLFPPISGQTWPAKALESASRAGAPALLVTIILAGCAKPGKTSVLDANWKTIQNFAQARLDVDTAPPQVAFTVPQAPARLRFELQYDADSAQLQLHDKARGFTNFYKLQGSQSASLVIPIQKAGDYDMFV